MRLKSRLGVTALLAAAPVWLSPAHAQSTAAQPAATESDGLGEIIVTARRTSENLQRVPVATSVIGAEVLAKQRVNVAADLQFTAPSLVVNQDALGGSGAPVFELRGQQQTLGSDPTVVTYFADIPIDTRVVAAGIYDLESVQVIRGPQGTLFGKNSTGGAVVLTPQHADTGKLGGNLSLVAGNYAMKQATGALNVPLINDVLAVRVSGQITRQDGFVRNLGGPDGADKHYETARVAVRFTPGSNLRNDLLFNYFNGDQHNNPAIVKALGGFALFFPQAQAGLDRQNQLGDRTIDMSFSTNYDKNRSYFISNTTSYELGNITLKNIFGYYKIHAETRFNQTSFNFPLVDVAQDRRSHQYSDEIQVTGHAFANNLNWIVGGFYSKQTTNVNQRAVVFSTDFTNSSISDDRFTSKALFAQGTLDLAGVGIAGLKVTAGVRSTWDKRDGSQVSFQGPTENGPGTLIGPLSLKTRRTSWTVGLDYQVTPDVLLYVASRHSYKAGGFNLTSNDTPLIFRTYAPESLTDVEIGAKTQFNLGPVPVRANLALYRGWYKDVQSFVVIRCFTPSGGSIVANAADGALKGLELELQAKLSQHLRVSGFYNRTLGNYGSFALPVPPSPCTFTGVTDVSGQIFGNIYKDAGGLTVDYSVPIDTAGTELALNANMYARSRKPGNGLASLNSPIEGYALFNARVDLNNIGGSAMSLGAFSRNITNKKYTIARGLNLNTGGYDFRQFREPRTYGIEVRLKF